MSAFYDKKKFSMKIAVIGATGLVGRVMIGVLEESKVFSGAGLIPVASERSVDKRVSFHGKDHAVGLITDALAGRPDIALFSAGAGISLQWAREFADRGVFVVDNSSAWRKHEEVPLVVPEINARTISKDTRIIANPNCSTIQLVMALYPIHRKYGIRRLVISTYQSVTGSGARAVKQLEDERKGQKAIPAYPHQIDLNLFPHGGDFLENAYTTEEQKLVDETRKILDDQNIEITATVVRVPVKGGHSEAVNVELESAFDIDAIRQLLMQTRGVSVQDDPANAVYPMPFMAEGKDDVFVGRIRRDHSRENTFNIWIVSDNLRKGAATNAVQIAEYLVASKLMGK
jgi:aspartate-semialdehyde dehydrogenase